MAKSGVLAWRVAALVAVGAIATVAAWTVRGERAGEAEAAARQELIAAIDVGSDGRTGVTPAEAEYARGLVAWAHPEAWASAFADGDGVRSLGTVNVAAYQQEVLRRAVERASSENQWSVARHLGLVAARLARSATESGTGGGVESPP